MFKRHTSIVLIIVFICCCASACTSSSLGSTGAALTFSDNGDFVIVHFPDMHECLHELDTLRPINVEFMNAVMDANEPDLVVLGGDNIFPLSTWGELTKKETLITIDAFGALFESRGQAWTMIFGNHDDEAIYDKHEMLVRAMQTGDCFIGGFDDGEEIYAFTDNKNDMVGNYALPLTDKDGNIDYVLYMLDSGSARDVGKRRADGYNYIRDTQVEWYRSTQATIREQAGKTKVPSIAFTHIPLYAHQNAYINRDTSLVSAYVGVFGGYSLSNTDSTFFDAACAEGDLKAIFTGHNHNTSFTAVVNTQQGGQIMLSTTRQSGEYLVDDATSFTAYARVICLYENGALTTYEYQNGPIDAISIG